MMVSPVFFDALSKFFTRYSALKRRHVQTPITTPPATATAGGVLASAERAGWRNREQGDPRHCRAPAQLPEAKGRGTAA